MNSTWFMKIGMILSILAPLSSCGSSKPQRSLPEPQTEEAKEIQDSALLQDYQSDVAPEITLSSFTAEVQLQIITDDAEKPVTYGDVAGIFAKSCVSCHYSAEDFDLRSFPFASIHQPDPFQLMELVLERVNSANKKYRMPLDPKTSGPGEALSEQERNLLQKWVNDGLLVELPAAKAVEDLVNTVVMEFSSEGKTENLVLTKDKKRSGVYRVNTQNFPAKLDSLVFKAYQGSQLVQKLELQDFNALNNPKVRVKLDLKTFE